MLESFLVVSVALFVLGTIVGSFLNVVIYRTFTGESWVLGRSHCEHCRHRLAWYENIPLFSYLWLRGKCRACGAAIQPLHPTIEFLTGTLFVWWYMGGFVFFRITQQPWQFVQPLFWLIVGLLLLVIFFADWRYQIIPDEAVWPLAVLTFLYRIALTLSGVMHPGDLLRTMIATIVCVGFFASLWWLTKQKGMGLGDVKLAAPFAMLLGWPNVVLGLFLAFVLGSLTSLALVATKRKTFKQTVPFGPFLVVAILVTLVLGSRIMGWYLGLLG